MATTVPNDTEVDPYGPPKPDDLQVAERAAQDVQAWLGAHAEVDEAEARLQRLLATIAFREVAKTELVRRERTSLAARIRWAYDWLRPRMLKPGTGTTVALPGGAELRTQAAGGKPKIEIDDEDAAMHYIRRRRWAKLLIVWKATLPKSKLQAHLDKAEQIEGVRVVHPPPGFFINGKKVDPNTGARVGKR